MNTWWRRISRLEGALRETIRRVDRLQHDAWARDQGFVWTRHETQLSCMFGPQYRWERPNAKCKGFIDIYNDDGRITVTEKE